MEKQLFVSNTITLANLYETIAGVIKEVGYEFQAPLQPEEEQEMISRQIKNAVLTTEEEGA